MKHDACDLSPEEVCPAAIDASSVHQITSGQVIVDLQSAVKELLENSLDAGATIVDVKFKDFGTTSFEVSDNGSGIDSSDFESIGTHAQRPYLARWGLRKAKVDVLALKSHTSKLASYDGLTEVTSFGFRGEALSSLCQLANLSITTATKQKAPVADVLTFDKRGKLLQTTKAARAVSEAAWPLCQIIAESLGSLSAERPFRFPNSSKACPSGAKNSNEITRSTLRRRRTWYRPTG